MTRCFYWTTQPPNAPACLYQTYARLPSTVLRHVRSVLAADNEADEMFEEEDFEHYLAWLKTAEPGMAYGSFGPIFETVCIDLDRSGEGGEIVDLDEEAAQFPPKEK